MTGIQSQGCIPATKHQASTIAVVLAAILGSVLLASRTSQAQDYQVLYRFTGHADGSGPVGDLLRDVKGNLYGTTSFGGAHGNGVIFKLDASGRVTVLYSFHRREARYANGALDQDQAGNLYGTAFYGGGQQWGHLGCGTVFKLDTAGTLTVLHVFTGGADGGNPAAGLIRDATGSLIGTTYRGGDGPCDVQGTPGCGVIFKLNPATGKYIVLHSFTGATTDTDGANPLSGLTQDAAGNLYGTTTYGGIASGCDNFGCGTVFELDTQGRYTVLYRFTGGSDGGNPGAGVLRDAAANLYGTTYRYGDLSCDAPYGCGTVFKLTGTGELIILHAFTGQGDGALPEENLIQDPTGALYSMTLSGGTNDGGTLFKLKGNGNERILHNYANGFSFAGLIRDDQGYLYGTTYNTGPNGNGTVFRVRAK